MVGEPSPLLPRCLRLRPQARPGHLQPLPEEPARAGVEDGADGGPVGEGELRVTVIRERGVGDLAAAESGCGGETTGKVLWVRVRDGIEKTSPADG